MKTGTFLILSAALLALTNCVEGPAGPQGDRGPQGLTGPAGEDGTSIKVVDSTYISSSNKLLLPINKKWFSTGIRVVMGDELLIKSSGEIVVDGSSYGPEGETAIGGLSYMLPNHSIYALFMRVGAASPVKVGRSYYGFASDSGTIEFSINSSVILDDQNLGYTIDSLTAFTAR